METFLRYLFRVLTIWHYRRKCTLIYPKILLFFPFRTSLHHKLVVDSYPNQRKTKVYSSVQNVKKPSQKKETLDATNENTTSQNCTNVHAVWKRSLETLTLLPTSKNFILKRSKKNSSVVHAVKHLPRKLLLMHMLKNILTTQRKERYQVMIQKVCLSSILFFQKSWCVTMYRNLAVICRAWAITVIYIQLQVV